MKQKSKSEKHHHPKTNIVDHVQGTNFDNNGF